MWLLPLSTLSTLVTTSGTKLLMASGTLTLHRLLFLLFLVVVGLQMVCYSDIYFFSCVFILIFLK